MGYPGVDSRSPESAYSTKRNIVLPDDSIYDILTPTVVRNTAAQHDELGDPTADAAYRVGTAGTSPGVGIPPDQTRATNVITKTYNVSPVEP
jgi:hypothetical protein